MASFDMQLKAMGLTLPDSMQQKALDFLRLLQKWNQTYNLTAIDDFDQMITHHLLDSLSVAPYLQGENLLDVGTGAGFPGIPLALYFPEKRFTLLDSNGKKTRFLLQAIAELDISNIDVVQSRVENYRTEVCFDAIISRAVKSISEMISKTQYLCCPAGQLLIMKGAYPAEELQHVDHLFVVETLSVAGLDAERHLIIIKDIARG